MSGRSLVAFRLHRHGRQDRQQVAGLVAPYFKVAGRQLQATDY